MAKKISAPESSLCGRIKLDCYVRDCNAVVYMTCNRSLVYRWRYTTSVLIYSTESNLRAKRIIPTASQTDKQCCPGYQSDKVFGRNNLVSLLSVKSNAATILRHIALYRVRSFIRKSMLKISMSSSNFASYVMRFQSFKAKG